MGGSDGVPIVSALVLSRVYLLVCRDVTYKSELLMAKHGSYDAAYSLFEELTNPVGPHRLQPERFRFHPDDYPSDAPLYIDDDDDYIYSFYRTSSHIITT